MFNVDLIYGVGEARRAHPKGLARLPNISSQKCTSITLFEKMPVLQALTAFDYKNIATDNGIQLKLF